MFNKLIQANSGDEAFVIETIDGPLNRREHVKSTVRLACLHCRSKKLKCTGEQNGCTRCRNKGVECSYRTSSKTAKASENSTNTSLPTYQSQRSSAASRQGDEGSLERLAASSPSDMSLDFNLVDVGMELDLDMALGSVPRSYQHHNHQASTTSSLGYETLNLDACFAPSKVTPAKSSMHRLGFPDADRDNSHLAEVNTAGMYSIGHSDAELDDAAFLDLFTHASASTCSNSAGSQSHSQSTSSRGDSSRGKSEDVGLVPAPSSSSSAATAVESNCAQHDMLRAFEIAEIRLVWIQHSSPDTMWHIAEDILQRQKYILNICKRRMSCTDCVFPSREAVLLISICERLLTSIIQMQVMHKTASDEVVIMSTQPQSQSQPQPHAQSSGQSHAQRRASVSSSSRERNGRAVLSRRNSTMAMAVDDSPADFASRLRKRQGEWNVDEEDKLQMIEALLDVRMRRLEQLVTELEELIISNRWLTHITMVQSLSARIARRLPSTVRS